MHKPIKLYILPSDTLAGVGSFLALAVHYVPRETFTPRYGKKREADFSVEGELAHEPRRKCPVEKFSVKEDSVSYKSIER